MVARSTLFCVRALQRPGGDHSAQDSSVMNAEAGEAHVGCSL